MSQVSSVTTSRRRKETAITTPEGGLPSRTSVDSNSSGFCSTRGSAIPKAKRHQQFERGPLSSLAKKVTDEFGAS